MHVTISLICPGTSFITVNCGCFVVNTLHRVWGVNVPYTLNPYRVPEAVL